MLTCMSDLLGMQAMHGKLSVRTLPAGLAGPFFLFVPLALLAVACFPPCLLILSWCNPLAMPQPNDFTEGLDAHLSVLLFTACLTFEQHVLLMSLLCHQFCLQLIMLCCKLLRTCSWRHVGRLCSDSLCVCPATACQLSVC